MKVRTSQRTVAFGRPFVLEGLGAALPAGDYCVETEEELVEGISYAAYRRTATVLLLPAEDGNGGLSRAVTVAPEDLEAALERDRLAAAPVPDTPPQDRIAS
jgi:hypothetical protein